jgi:hypothetical protein
MADGTTPTITMDPFFALATEIESTKTKVADSVFESYKLQVAQSADVNNRAMQVALKNAAAQSNLKKASSNSTLQTMLAAARTDGALAQTAMSTQREVMHQAERDRNLINNLNTQNLNTALINTTTALIGGGLNYANLGLAYGGLNSAVQTADQLSAINAFQSSIAGQRTVNTGSMTGTTQAANPTTIG